MSSLNSSAVVIFKRDALTGALSQTPGAECVRDSIRDWCRAPGAVGLAGAKVTVVSPDGRHAYVAGSSSDSVAAFSRDPVSGLLTQLPGAAACIRDTLMAPSIPCPATVTGLDNPRGLTITPDGRHVYAGSLRSDAVTGFARNSTTGALSAAGCVEGRHDLPRRRARRTASDSMPPGQ